MIAAEGDLLAAKGDIIAAEDGLAPFEGDMMRFEGDITSFVGCMTILKNLRRLQILYHAGAASPEGAISLGRGLRLLRPLSWISA